MAEKIYTIPINDAFDEYDGCPLCRLHARLERQSLEYIMGAAMMEPDIRTDTNRLGFCREHYDFMLGMKNRLSLALTLESRLAAVKGILPQTDIKLTLLSKVKKNESDRAGEAVQAAASTCYVCQRAGQFESQYLSNVVYVWKTDTAFREKLKKQPFFCLDHYGKLLTFAQKELNESLYSEFAGELSAIEAAYLDSISADVTAFCRSFDHLSSKTPLTEEQKSSVNRAIDFLAGI